MPSPARGGAKQACTHGNSFRRSKAAQLRAQLAAAGSQPCHTPYLHVHVGELLRGPNDLRKVRREKICDDENGHEVLIVDWGKNFCQHSRVRLMAIGPNRHKALDDTPVRIALRSNSRYIFQAWRAQ